MTNDELAREQAHVDRAYARLAVLRERARALIAGVLDRRQVATHQARYERDVTVAEGARRLAALELGTLPLVFGRIDRTDGEHFHIGRVAVGAADRTPLVVDWRAPVAEPFYRATSRAPLGLTRRRHFRTRGQRLLGMDDDGFGDAESELTFVGEAALLEALSRSRTGRMADIVTTIQGEQDAVIRAPLSGVLVVQGGPGTGKTAVALHRAAYLLYTHRRRLEASGVLLVGPTAVFLRYIEEVLPSLGEQRVRMATIADLMDSATATAADPPAVARLKGDPRMTRVLARVQGSGPKRALHGLLSSRQKIARAAGAILSAQEQAALHRHEWRGWSPEDLPLLDELAALRPPRPEGPRRRVEREQRWELERLVDEFVAAHPTDRHMALDLVERLIAERAALEEPTHEGEVLTYGHVLVDEAQDLTPMQWRMLQRRCPGGSMTIVGDLGQATGVWPYDRWEEVTALLGTREAKVAELTINYRTPAEIMAFADRIRPVRLPSARPVRHTGGGPTIHHIGPRDDLPSAAGAAVATCLRVVDGSVGVIAPTAVVGTLSAPGERVSVSGVADVKGLEFDAVVVVEPAAIAEESSLRALYVALTRATQRLTIITTRPLPPALEPYDQRPQS